MPRHCPVAATIAEAKDPGRPGAATGWVLVVGTTPDYVAKIHASHPQTALFLMRASQCHHPQLAKVPAGRLHCDPFRDDRSTCQAVRRWMAQEALTLAGVACFDCEALITAGRIAQAFDLPFAELTAVARTRNKFETKRCWSEAGIETPAGIVASGLKETLGFFHHHPAGIVLKPLSASGSELAFHCLTPAGVRRAVGTLQEQLPRRKANPLFQVTAEFAPDARPLNPCRAWVVESYVPGPEFSCDFFLKNHQVRIIRSTGKIKAETHPFGSMLAYTFPPRFPDGFSIDALARTCLRAATAMGFTLGHFMLDYIVHKGDIVLLEMTPRPGGDSIPDLIAAATGVDLIGLHLDWACGLERVPAFARLACESFASINFYAPSQGFITGLDASLLKGHPDVRQVVLKKQVGDRVVLPPADYDNRLLGYCIVEMAAGQDLLALAKELNDALKVTIHPLAARRGGHETP
jgi:biotin carboxylase